MSCTVAFTCHEMTVGQMMTVLQDMIAKDPSLVNAYICHRDRMHGGADLVDTIETFTQDDEKYVSLNGVHE